MRIYIFPRKRGTAPPPPTGPNYVPVYASKADSIRFAKKSRRPTILVESLSGDILQKSIKICYTKPKLELHTER